MIVFKQVSKIYSNGFEALKNASFEIPRGELAFITGHSGAGKSTLLKLIAAIERPTAGQIHLNGQNISKIDKAAIPFLRRNIGFIFQDHKLLFNQTVLENVLLPLKISGVDDHESLERAKLALDRVGLIDKAHYAPIMLSGGEQQRLCIARAVVNKPKLLLADEPTGHLDLEYALDIMQIFFSFNEVGVTVLISTHDDSILKRYSQRRLILSHGQIISDR